MRPAMSELVTMSHRAAELERQLWGPNLTALPLVAELPQSAREGIVRRAVADRGLTIHSGISTGETPATPVLVGNSFAYRGGRCYTTTAVCTPAGEVAYLGAAPKEQPPRKLSGKRTAGARALWKAAAGDLTGRSPKE
jgi:hypothetical protein